MPKSLVIVESPAKARTISKFLDKSFIVEASIGHIRDLPRGASEIPDKLKSESWTRLGVDIENDFEPLYVISDNKKSLVKKLKEKLKNVDMLYLATDEDREGEAISWHLVQALKPKAPVARLVFHEITKSAIQDALDNPRDIDKNLVMAQETRRVVDRLYGYEISPLLWKKVAPRLSAGRVQSVAVKLIVDREKERSAFTPSTYWDITATLKPVKGASFGATLRSVDGKKLAGGKDFDPKTGNLLDPKLAVYGEKKIKKLLESLEKSDWSVANVVTKPIKQSPPAPYTTSSLQQDANRKLGMAARDTMRVAQSLYENGHITYMRTDSTTLASEAIKGIRSKISRDYGADYLPAQPRLYKSKVKNAQEAHEAIRPAGSSFPEPVKLKSQLDARGYKLYDLIWRRAVACQMTDARVSQTTIDINATKAEFRASGRIIDFDGFLKVYSPPVNNSNGKTVAALPKVKNGEALDLKEIDPVSHITKPPARFTEATLIKELETLGIGRPSTYAAIIDTIMRRDYVFKKGTALTPTFIAYAVAKLLENFFPSLVDPTFTAQMEDDLDAISRGELERTPYLHEFYFGSKSWQGLKKLVGQEIDARDICTFELGADSNGEAVNVRIGRWGPYVERGDSRARIPDGLAPDELTIERALELIEAESDGPTELGRQSETDEPIFLLNGRFGPYLQLGERDNTKGAAKPKQKSLLPGMTPDEVTLEIAIKILSLPRELGNHPETDEPVIADLGRYGPYLKCGDETRSLSASDNVIKVDLKQALEILKRPKRKSFRRASKALKELGEHPDRKGVTLRILNGRFGPYITDGKTHVSVPNGSDPQSVTLEEAVALYETKLGSPPRKKKKSVRKKTTKNISPRKTATKKSSRKTASGKATAKKTAA
ncbi:MAG: type I DNA topoisomerase [candidate division Zixibacteria bacterium]|nr:type I DNA topoisomerase [candidate division Zixibacteria bacterium]